MSDTHTRPWAATLTLNHQERLESRIRTIVQSTTTTLTEDKWIIEEIDATGALGNRLTARANETTLINLTTSELLILLQEDGQIIELDASLEREGHIILQIIVRDGVSVDILGTGEPLSTSVLGSHTAIDPRLFWHS
ncbi:hypothetical protein [Sorangium sp. So ce1000]|uniref:hypothetical protein n=1 Tax=Sorangium sp. So ce1000 TaxID=3133325 RepID=UPI003F611410